MARKPGAAEDRAEPGGASPLPPSEAEARALSRANDDFANLLANGQMAIVILDPELRIRRFTPAAEKLLSLIPTDTGRPFRDIRMRVEPPDLEKLLKNVMDTMAPHELDVQDRDGAWYSLRVRPYRTTENRIEGAVVVLVDIDSQKRAEQAIRTSAERLRLVQDLAPVGIFEADLSGRLLEVNGRFCCISGYPHDELLRENLRTLIEESDRERIDEAWVAAQGDGEPRRIEACLQRKGGGSGWVELAFVVQRQAGGDGAFVIGTVSDINERKRSEAALHETENRFRQLADSAPVLIWMNDLEGCIFVNRAFIEQTGAAERELLGMGWLEFLHPDDRESYLGTYLAAKGEALPFESQFRLRIPDGGYRWMKSMALPRVDGRGEVSGYVGSSFDVHELKLAEDELRAADRRKNEFLAMLAHELRNPLAPMRNVIELLRAGDSDEGQLTWAREVMDRQVDAMSRMIEDLLDVSRITQGKIQLRLEPADLKQLLQRLAQTWEARFAQRRQTLHLRLPEDPAPALVDVVRIEQVLGNLLGNAAKFTSPGGNVWLEAEPSAEPWIEIRVRDDGKGIAREALPRIFDLFVQADQGLDRAQGGLGIGLTLVQRLIELHGGEVEAKSDGPGAGSTFTVRVPRLAGPPVRRPGEGADRSERKSPTAHRRVLVVDDNVDGALSWAILLRLQGHEVQVAHSGEDALGIAEEFRPEVAIVDIGLPGMDGIELGRRLRHAAWSDGLLLVAVSGYAGEEDRQRTREAGFDHHFRKPLEPDTLFSLLDSSG